MAGTFAVTSTVIATAVATGGTFTVSYPTGTTGALFTGAVSHKLYAMGGEYLAPRDFTLTFNTNDITVTWNGQTSLPVGASVRINIDILGADVDANIPLNRQIIRAPMFGFNFGAPAAPSANSIALSQAVAGGGQFALNGARGSTLDVPRNVVAAWTTASVITIRGFDVDGAALTEVAPSGTSFIGKKTFAYVSSITSSIAITAATAGSGLLLGFPARITAASQLIYEVKNGVTAAPTGATIAGVTTAATGASGDVRGTYSPLAAVDGATSYSLLVVSGAPDDRGVAQYAA